MPQCKWIVHKLFAGYGAAQFSEAKMTTLYKILSRPQWEKARSAGVFEGSEVDISDGFIHLSSPHQVRETAQKHFSGQTDLLLVSVRAETLGETLKWEVSRGGALFPHIYGTLPIGAVIEAVDLPWEGGSHHFPEGLAQ